MRRLRGRLTYSNVMVTILAFLMLSGGAAYAASQLGKNSVGSKQIKKNSITTAKIKSGAVTGAKVKAGSLTGAQVQAGSLTGTQINASTLGTVPSAANASNADNARALGGQPGSAFASAGRFMAGSATTGSSEPAKVLFTIPGAIQVLTHPTDNTEVELSIKNVSASPWTVSYSTPTSAASFSVLPGNTGDVFGASTQTTMLVSTHDSSDLSKIVNLQCGLDFLNPPHVLSCTSVSSASV